MENREVIERLDKIIGLLAVQGKEKEEQLKVLTALGFSNSDMSTLTGIPKGTIDVIRANQKKKTKRNSKKILN
jgi:uncharacterized protein (UPF0218 family)